MFNYDIQIETVISLSHLFIDFETKVTVDLYIIQGFRAIVKK